MKEFTHEEAIAYVKSIGKKSKRFYCNVYGWSGYYTLEPTARTPTGRLKGYPRTKVIKADQ